MILADENIDPRFIRAIESIPIEVFSVQITNSGLGDEEIIELSRNPPRIILTEDKDFGEWIFAHHVKGISVIFLRYHYSDIENMIEKVGKSIRQIHHDYT